MSTFEHDSVGPDGDRQLTKRLDPLTDEEAVREVGWVARRARELVERSDDVWPDWAEFFDRRARLLEHMGQPALASDARVKADHVRRAWSNPPDEEFRMATTDFRHRWTPLEGLGRWG